MQKAEKKLVKLEKNSAKAEVKKITKKKVKSQIGKLAPNILLMSEYLQTIASPETVFGMKIPDANTSLSFTSHCVQRIQYPAQAATGTYYLSAICCVYGAVGSGNDYYLGLASGSGSGGVGITWTAMTKSYASALTNTIAPNIRPVSGSVVASYQASTTTDQGRIIVAYAPGPQLGSVAFAPAPDVTSILKLPMVTDFPANKRFARTRYIPTDPISQSYTFQGNGNFPTRASGVGGTQYGVAYILVDGCQNGNVMEFTMCENFECLPGINSANFVSPTTSKSDPMELSMVSNKLSDSQTFSVNQSAALTNVGTAEVAPSGKPLMSTASHAVNNETFFEKVMNGVEKYGPLIARGAKVLGSLL
jgi:hypothetical protein